VYVGIIRKLIPISEAAKLLGVYADTLRRWEREGKIKPRRTSGNLRRYDTLIFAPILSTLRLRLCALHADGIIAGHRGGLKLGVEPSVGKRGLADVAIVGV
jgi:excisionase family DNA binding protein